MHNTDPKIIEELEGEVARYENLVEDTYNVEEDEEEDEDARDLFASDAAQVRDLIRLYQTGDRRAVQAAYHTLDTNTREFIIDTCPTFVAYVGTYDEWASTHTQTNS